MVKVERLCFAFVKNNTILNNINFSITNKGITSIFGNSGCGKSTLLNLLAGLLKPLSGSIDVSEKNLAYLTQSISLLLYNTAFENSLLAVELRNKLNIEKKHEAEKLFQEFSLDKSVLNKYPNELSGGMKQRVALIQTLLVETGLYLLDEPFTAIDRITTQKIQETIWKRFRDKESSAIVVTHDIEQAVSFSDRVVIMPDILNAGMREISFNKEFASLPPSQRKLKIDYDNYIFDIIKMQSEAK